VGSYCALEICRPLEICWHYRAFGAGGPGRAGMGTAAAAGASVLFETSPGNAELINEFGSSAPSPIGDSALAALYQAGT
jgi:hypothetical protein